MSDTTCRCGRPTTGTFLCPDCGRTLAYAVANIAGHYEDLGTLARKQTRYGNAGATKGSIGKAQPAPVDMRFISGPPDAAHRNASMGPLSQLRWDTWNTVVAWARTLMEEQDQVIGPVCLVTRTNTGSVTCLHTSCANIRRRTWPTNTIRSMCLYLDRNHRWIDRSEWSPALLDELLDLERRLVSAVNSPPERWYAGKCSAQGLLDEHACAAELYATAERGTLVCKACGTEHDVAGRRDFLLAEAKDYLVTATEAAGALLAWTDYDGSETKLVDRICKWRDRLKLEVADVTSLHGKDRHLYRLGDIQDLLVQHAQRDQQRALTA